MADRLADPDLVSLEEAAALLGMNRNTVYRYARAGLLPGAIKVGSLWRFSLVRYRRTIHGQDSEGER